MEISVNKQEWIQALRSGHYQQCKGTLTDNVGFCCLGVWAKINGFETIYEEGEIDEQGYMSDPDDYMLLNGKRYNYDIFTKLLTYTTWTNLAEKNDSGATFEEIADIIEEEIEEKTITI